MGTMKHTDTGSGRMHLARDTGVALCSNRVEALMTTTGEDVVDCEACLEAVGSRNWLPCFSCGRACSRERWRGKAAVCSECEEHLRAPSRLDFPFVPVTGSPQSFTYKPRTPLPSCSFGPVQ